MNEALHTLAALAGIATSWIDYRGVHRNVADDSLRQLLQAMELPCASIEQCRAAITQLQADQQAPSLPPLLTATCDQPLTLPLGEVRDGMTLPVICEDGSRLLLRFHAGDARQVKSDRGLSVGYHRLQLAKHEITVAVAPSQAWSMQQLAPQRRLWGVATQLYALRSAHSTGIGDFGSLREFVLAAAARGADAVAISPVHAQFAADVDHYSPYAPSSRLFVNALHADPAALIGADALNRLLADGGLSAERERLERLPLIDWPAAARLRWQILRGVYARLQAQLHGTDLLAQDFAQFCASGGEALQDHARFEVLHALQLRQGRWHWRDWPAALRDPRSPAVTRELAQQQDEFQFHLFAQWLAARGIAQAQQAALGAGMRIGLIGDLAVGTSSGGSHSWSRQHEMLDGISVGAPPDLLNALGQSWGLTAFSPRALQHNGYSAFIELLRASLRNVGGLRIDHVLGLRRLWLVPEGAKATEGAYLRYPLEDLLRLIALESWQHRAVIVGEDLGTVPEGFREQMDQHALMGMRVLWFERDHGLFVEPSRWSADAMATTTTHDLPSVTGWWYGRDIDWRVQLELMGEHADEAGERAARVHDRQTLWAALQHAGASEQAQLPEDAAPVVDAALRFVARTPSQLMMAPIEDLLGLAEQPNLPGTIDEHPNWQRRLPADSETLLDAPATAARLAMLRKERA